MSHTQLNDLDEWPCSECRSTGPIANAEYMITYDGRAFACRDHLADSFDYATTINIGFSPVVVTSLRAVIAA